MVDTKTPGDKTLSVPTKTLSLKPRVETGTVRQSFSHGRTKQVVVEKRGKRRVGGDAPAPETHAPEPVIAKPASRRRLPPAPRPPAAPRSNSGVVLRTLTEDERSARASALADAKVRDVEERRLPKKKPSAAPAAKASSRPSAKRPKPAARPKKSVTVTTRKPSARPSSKPRSALARPKRGRDDDNPPGRGDNHRPARQSPSHVRPALRPTLPTRMKARARFGAADRAVPSLPPKPTAKPAPQKQRGRLTLVTALNADDVRERSIASFRRRTQRLKGHQSNEPKEKLIREVVDPGSHQHPGTRQPHGGARRRRHPPADEAGRDAQDHRRDRRRHRAADRRRTGSYGQARGRFRRRRRPVRRRRQFHRHRAALACRDRDGSRRPRQDLAARRAAPRQRGFRRSRRHHPAYRRLSGDLARKRQEDHLHRYARPRRVHRDARPRRQGDRHRGAGGGCRRRRDAADGGSDQPRQGGEGADDRRHQQDRQARRQARARAHRTAAIRGSGRIARRRGGRRRSLRQEQDQSRPAARDDRVAGRYSRPQDQFDTSRPKAP